MLMLHLCLVQQRLEKERSMGRNTAGADEMRGTATRPDTSVARASERVQLNEDSNGACSMQGKRGQTDRQAATIHHSAPATCMA